jgi:hypothetical protein
MRAFYPLPYLANAMADMLWDSGLQIRSHRKKVMSTAFGRHVSEVETYFALMVRSFRTGGKHEHRSVLGDRSPAGRKKLMVIASAAQGARRRFSTLARSEKGVVRRSLELLAVHAEHMRMIAEAHAAGIDRNKRAVKAMRGAYEKRLPAILSDFHSWIDPLIAEPVRRAFEQASRLAG